VINPILKVRGLVHAQCFENIKKDQGNRANSAYTNNSRNRVSTSSATWSDTLSTGPTVATSHNLGYVEKAINGKNTPSTNSSKTASSEKSIEQNRKNEEFHDFYSNKGAQNINLLRSTYLDLYDDQLSEMYNPNSDKSVRTTKEDMDHIENQFRNVMDGVGSAKNNAVKNQSEDLKYTKDGLYIEGAFIKEIKKHGQSYFYTIFLKYTNGEVDVLQRSDTEIWNFHLDMLTEYPIESGREEESRKIPFMRPFLQEMSALDINQCKLDLNRYFEQFFRLSSYLIYSDIALEFLDLFEGDIENADIDGKDLYELNRHRSSTHQITIKLILGEEVIQWKDISDLNYDHLFFTVEKKLGFQFDNILYMDETNQLVFLNGDDDLKLLTCLKEFEIYVS
jgi:hypothetical protein